MKLTKQQEKIRELVLKETPQGIYNRVLSGELEQFPKGFWSMPENYDYCKKCVYHLVFDILKYDKLNFISKFTAKELKEYKLTGMFINVNKQSLYNLLTLAFNDSISLYDMTLLIPNEDFTTKVLNSIKHLYTEKYRYNKKFVAKTYSYTFLKSMGIHLDHLQTNSYDTLNIVFPNEFRIWDLEAINVRWNNNLIKEVVKHIFVETYKFDKLQVTKYANAEFLRSTKFARLLSIEVSIYDLVNTAFPNTIMPWELTALCNDYWTEETVILAVKWLYTKRYRFNHSFVVKTFKFTFLQQNKLTFKHIANFRIIFEAFPNEFTEQDFRRNLITAKDQAFNTL